MIADTSLHHGAEMLKKQAEAELPPVFINFVSYRKIIVRNCEHSTTEISAMG